MMVTDHRPPNGWQPVHTDWRFLATTRTRRAITSRQTYDCVMARNRHVDPSQLSIVVCRACGETTVQTVAATAKHGGRCEQCWPRRGRVPHRG